jgi:serine/threonine protein kinase
MKVLAPNSLIQNRYLVVHLIGKGGMGEVYLAVDQRLGSAVALKRTFFADDEMLGGAFEREARILARLRHPVLPKVSDHFAENGEQYLVMEHIAGDDLAKRLESAQKPFPMSWVLIWADQLLDSLSYLHSHEPPIIHRDIKPQNLKLTDENHIVLLDFGLSKNSTGQTKTPTSGGSTGSVVGYTPHYAPMEQIRGTGTDPRSDIYSLSATLYQLMSNSVPADALTRADALLNGSADPIQPLSDLNPEVPREVSAVILHGMEVSQERRYGDAKTMQKALRKAYSSMQDAMSAQTVAFMAPGEISSKIEQPVLGHTVESNAREGDSERATKLRDEPPAAAVPASVPNFDETIRYDGPIEGAPPRQADVKTEVYTGGNGPLSTEIPPVKSEPFVADVPSSPANEWDVPASTGNGGYVADATVANAFVNTAPPPTPFELTENYASPEIPAADPYATRTPSTTVSRPASVPQPPVVSKPVKKKSKAVWVVGVLAVLFVMGVAAAGGGWFVYKNYFESAAVTPSPSPEPTLEVTPTPEPTLEAITNSNNSNTQVESNSNTNTNVFVEPTPQPTVEIRDENPYPRNTPQVEVKKTPAVKTTPAAKPTQAATPKKPKILQ